MSQKQCQILQNKERIYPLVEAYELATGQHVNLSVAWRHSQNGIAGIKLEFVIFGNRRMTSVEAVQRFIEARTNSRLPVSRARNKDRSKEIEKADAEIDRLTKPTAAKRGRKKREAVA